MGNFGSSFFQSFTNWLKGETYGPTDKAVETVKKDHGIIKSPMYAKEEPIIYERPSNTQHLSDVYLTIDYYLSLFAHTGVNYELELRPLATETTPPHIAIFQFYEANKILFEPLNRHLHLFADLSEYDNEERIDEINVIKRDFLSALVELSSDYLKKLHEFPTDMSISNCDRSVSQDVSQEDKTPEDKLKGKLSCYTTIELSPEQQQRIEGNIKLAKWQVKERKIREQEDKSNWYTTDPSVVITESEYLRLKADYEQRKLGAETTGSIQDALPIDDVGRTPNESPPKGVLIPTRKIRKTKKRTGGRRETRRRKFRH